ncbi:hypothetical protein NUU61_008544 [Penicillium alfredii]|uniref:FAD-dependent oxidoreductase 2 FAD-binding domain-containing protein n=1 Tax=Penicillium alfredii TaxID=1506179 RepID=A0A9W9ELM2_9EURO|nr:uncharacterized protein NUU61_008544 [Penicillium alfredii]KAJ5083965.1 hypothetical protein NUU61_008544 [Penicillium alfredii]
MSSPPSCHILVIGTGNAGLSAALTAKETNPSAQVTVIDKCPATWAGGNTYFTAGAFRATHAGLADLLPLVNNTSAEDAARIDLAPYSAADFAHDLHRMTGGRADPQLADTLVRGSRGAVGWLARRGVRFQLSFNRQAYEVGGRVKFWGGLALKTEDGGKGLVQDLMGAARKSGVRVIFDTAVTGFHVDPHSGSVVGVDVVCAGTSTGTQSIAVEQHTRTILAKAVILAAGGFEANPQLRAQYLGPGWDAARVRGTPYNTGEVLQIAQRDCNAKAAGNWSGCHSVAWDADASPHTGNRAISNEFTKSGYPLGVMVNRDGVRFVDEGADLRNYTYAMIGRRILQQPAQLAFQVWDARVTPWLRAEEYRPEVVRHLTGGTLAELADRCVEVGLVGKERFLATMEEYNRAVLAHNDGGDGDDRLRRWDPAVKDGLATTGLDIPKSNWALPIDPGITFTFGGLAVDPETAAVISQSTQAIIPGLYCAGEMLGGIFHDNYPGGSGLTSGTVFGRRAGRAAAERIATQQAGSENMSKL